MILVHVEVVKNTKAATELEHNLPNLCWLMYPYRLTSNYYELINLVTSL
jgi:hypothetical protein